MAADPKVSKAAAVAMLDALVDSLDVGSGTAMIRIYDTSGSIPTNVEATDSGATVLAELTFDNPAFGASTQISSPHGARATANTIGSDTSANNTGTAKYFRAFDRDGTAVIQGTCGTSSADMILNTTSIVAGATVSCSSYIITLPNGGS